MTDQNNINLSVGDTVWFVSNDHNELGEAQIIWIRGNYAKLFKQNGFEFTVRQGDIISKLPNNPIEKRDKIVLLTLEYGFAK